MDGLLTKSLKHIQPLLFIVRASDSLKAKLVLAEPEAAAFFSDLLAGSCEYQWVLGHRMAGVTIDCDTFWTVESKSEDRIA